MAIAQLFAIDKSLHQQIKSILSKHNFYSASYLQDVIQDLSLIILQYKNSDRLLTICHQNNLKYWIIAVLSNLKKDNNSKINKQYRTIDLEIRDSSNTESETVREDIFSVVEAELLAIGKKNWYKEKIFREYLRCQEQWGEDFTYKRFGEELNIDKDSLFAHVKEVKQRIQRKIKNEQ